MSAVQLLDRLQGVRATGPGRWLARCPAHEDRAPSLSIRELEDGRVLLHDFGGCETGAVLGALGLQLQDLYPLGSRGEFQPSRSRIPAADLLRTIGLEVGLVAIIGAEMVDRKRISEQDWQRLAQAVRRIGAARAYVG
ncbi:MAG: DNA primase [Pseudomonadota bacterium]